MAKFEAGKKYGNVMVRRVDYFTPVGNAVGIIKYAVYGEPFKELLFTDGENEYFYSYVLNHKKITAI